MRGAKKRGAKKRGAKKRGAKKRGAKKRSAKKTRDAKEKMNTFFFSKSSPSSIKIFLQFPKLRLLRAFIPFVRNFFTLSSLFSFSLVPG